MKITRYNLPQAFKKGQIPFNKGKHLSKKHKKSLSEAQKKRFAKSSAWNKGKPAPWASERNRKLNPLRRGKNAYHWKGGTYGTERHRDMARQEYKQWRSDVFERDNWTCQTCGIRGVYLEAHHIKSWKNYPELRYEVSNGVTLCRDCHKLTLKNK